MQMHSEPSEFVGTAEACTILGKDRATITRWVEKGKLKSHKLPGLTGAHLYNRADVETLRDELAEAASA